MAGKLAHEIYCKLKNTKFLITQIDSVTKSDVTNFDRKKENDPKDIIRCFSLAGMPLLIWFYCFMCKPRLQSLAAIPLCKKSFASFDYSLNYIEDVIPSIESNLSKR